MRRILSASLLLVCSILLVILGDGLTDEPGGADLAVVLGNAVHPNGTPSPRLAARLARAQELYDEGRVERILVSGGVDASGTDEAVHMAAWLRGRGVPEAAILVDSHGTSTWATARAVQRLVHTGEVQSVVVVSQYFHVPRAKVALHRLGVDDVKGSHARYAELRDVYSVAREMVALPAYAWGSIP